jgi:hypothetical protein
MVSPFAGRTLCIATMHRKEQVLAPLLESQWLVRCLPAPAGLDTDQFGTFSGEVARRGTARETARAKAQAALALTAADLVVTSEGSFGPHPHSPLVPVGSELVLLLERSSGREFCGEDVTIETNHARRECQLPRDAADFARRIGFPTHGVLLLVDEPPQRVWRDVDNFTQLHDAATAAQREARCVGRPWSIASDMRAHRNPTRMRAIARAGHALAQRVLCSCPHCAAPGFGPVEVVLGLPCQWCATPVPLPRATIHGCVACSFRREVSRLDGITAADPGSCPSCNP